MMKKNSFCIQLIRTMKLDFKRNNYGAVEEVLVTGHRKSDKTGMVKQKDYDWKDSNLALFGSDTEKSVKKTSAETEPAWRIAKSTTVPSLFIWRIEKFKVNSLPKEEFGKFYNGDSYIILKINKEEDSPELLYDVHFWIGKRSSQDEYGTAAYKTVELDTLLDDKAVQHREVQGNETDLFKSYFPVMTIMKGGCESGFHHVTPDKYEPRLLHFRCTDQRHVELVEVKLSKQALDSEDVLILDNGLEVFQWNGKLSNKNEKFKAAQFLQQLKSERSGRVKTDVLDEEFTPANHRIFKLLPDVPFTKKTQNDLNMTKTLYRLSDETGKMTFSCISEGSVPRSMLKDDDVYMIDNGRHLFVYIGARASQDEKKNAMSYAHNYLKTTEHPLIGITCLQSGQYNKEYDLQLE